MKMSSGVLNLKDMVLSEGPRQILQLILQKQVDGFMEEKMSNVDDYVDWLKWVFETKRRRQAMFKFSNYEKNLMLL